MKSIAELMDQVGWAGACLYNERTKRLIDGHARRALAIERKEDVEVIIGDWSEEQEALILASLDPTGWTAVGDRNKLKALLAGPFPELRTEAMKSLLDAVKGSARLLEPQEETREDELLEVSLPLDSLWPTDNPWSVPSLLPELCADQVPFPVTTWGTIGARRPMAGTWHFYTSDRKFEPLWKRPHRVLYSRPNAVVEPNFSTTDQTPFAVALWHIYRKRWLARYWQSQACRIFVDLNVDAGLNAPHAGVEGRTPNLLGVPAGWKAFASRAHANHPETLLTEFEVAKSHCGHDTPLFLVIGGGRRVQDLAREHGWVWVPEQIQSAHTPKDEAA